MADILTSEGCRVVTTDSGAEALRYLKNSPVDLVVSDVMMPDMDGYELFQELRTHYSQVPVVLMLPWTIVLIAIFVELNFRGFQLGRWLVLCGSARLPFMTHTGPALAIGASSLLFAFDPFMVATFKHLHWIAIWDGIVWGTVWVRLRNLYATMCAHAVEVIMMYSVVRHSLT